MKKKTFVIAGTLERLQREDGRHAGMLGCRVCLTAFPASMFSEGIQRWQHDAPPGGCPVCRAPGALRVEYGVFEPGIDQASTAELLARARCAPRDWSPEGRLAALGASADAQTPRLGATLHARPRPPQGRRLSGFQATWEAFRREDQNDAGDDWSV